MDAARALRGSSTTIAVAALAVAISVTVTAGASGGGDASAKPSQQVKKLKQRVAALEGRVDGLALQPGPPGPQGPQGSPGTPGTPGTPGATDVIVRTGSSSIGGGFTSSPFGISCNSGEVATGGGVGFASPTTGDAVAFSVPTSNGLLATDGQTPTGWLGSIRNGDANPRTATTFVICARP